MLRKRGRPERGRGAQSSGAERKAQGGLGAAAQSTVQRRSWRSGGAISRAAAQLAERRLKAHAQGGLGAAARLAEQPAATAKVQLLKIVHEDKDENSDVGRAACGNG